MQLTAEQLRSLSQTGGLQFSGPSQAPRIRRQIQPLPPPNMNISTSILAELLNMNITGLILSYYSNSSLFPLNLTNRTIATPVIGVTINDESENFNLIENVTINFHLPTPVSL